MTDPPGVPRDVPRPLAVIHGWRGGWACLAPAAVIAVTIVGLIAGQALPDLLGPSVAAPPTSPAATALALLGGVLAATALRGWVATRSGRVELFPDRVARGPRTTFLMDVDAFRDDASDHVALVQRRAWFRMPPRKVAVPTPREPDRLALIHVLERAGVPRDGAPDARLRAPPRVLLVASGPVDPLDHLTRDALVRFALGVFLLALPCLATGGGLLCPLVAFFVPVSWWVYRAYGTVVFSLDRICVGGRYERLAWDDVVGWRPDQPWHGVRLVLRAGLADRWPGEVVVPAWTADDREPIAELLTSRGIPRL